MDATLNMTAALFGATMMTVVCLSLIGALLAWQSYLAQPLAVFAGLGAAQSLFGLYYLAGTIAFFFAPNWLVAFMGGELTRLFFFALISGCWLVFPLGSPRLSASQQNRSRLWLWLLALFIAVVALAGFGLWESIRLSADPSFAKTNAVFRQILAGSASGFLLISSGFIGYRIGKLRHAVWLWLLFAALALLFTVALQYFQRDVILNLTPALVIVVLVFILLALLADRARYLQLESQLRHSLLEEFSQLAGKAQNAAAALSHLSEGVVQIDLDGRITYANEPFAVLAGNAAAKLYGQSLREALPLPLYEALVPAVQEARRERAAQLEANCALRQQEKVLQIAHAPLFNEHQKLNGVHLGVIDVTRYRSGARTLGESLAEKSREVQALQHGLDQIVDAVALLDAQHKIIYANEAFARGTGLPRRELLGQEAARYRAAPLYPWPEIRKRLSQNLLWRGEVRESGKEGRTIASDLTVLPVSDDQQPHYLWIERDLSAQEHRIAERTTDLERRVQQLAKLMEISENIRLNVSLEVIMQSVADAIHTLGWQRVAVFFARGHEVFELAASAGFDTNAKKLPNKFRQLTYADFAPYLVETFRLGSSFLVKSTLLDDQRPEFMPKELDVFRVGEWRPHDCLLVPIRTREQLAGMITVFCPHAGRYPELQHVRELESYADEAAIAIQNSRLLVSLAAREQHARWLNRIGNAFRAAGTLEGVLGEIAAIITEALQQPVLIAMPNSPNASENDGTAAQDASWLAASAALSRKHEAAKRNLVIAAEHEKILRKLFACVATEESKDWSHDREELAALLRLPNSREEQRFCSMKIFALRSRAQPFGFIAWLAPEDFKYSNPEQADFVRDLVAQATLTLDNMRLFLQTEERARALLRANSHTSEFLASVSHELRTPLHGILQFSEVLLRSNLEKEQKQHVEIVQRSGKNLLALINDILDLSKIEAGKMEAVWEEFDLVALLRESLDTVQSLCNQKGLHLQRFFDPVLPKRFVSDPAILGRVLTNLLGNAEKFTQAGAIILSARVQGERLLISVKDTGIGMPKNRLKEIFEPFRQLESSEARQHSGTGLGLAISQRMMRILGGKIEVESEVGKGSQFTVILPVRAPATFVKAAATKPAPGKIKPAAKTSEQKKAERDTLILVIDDDENARRAMRFILEDEGYRVLFAENGEMALPLAQREQPNLILMDIMMPGLDGYQVARMLKSQKLLKNVPLVALTARAMKGDREKAAAAGCDDYLTKPFETKEILEMIQKWTR